MIVIRRAVVHHATRREILLRYAMLHHQRECSLSRKRAVIKGAALCCTQEFIERAQCRSDTGRCRSSSCQEAGLVKVFERERGHGYDTSRHVILILSTESSPDILGLPR